MSALSSDVVSAVEHDGIGHKKKGITGGSITHTFPTGILPHVIHWLAEGRLRVDLSHAHTVWCNAGNAENYPVNQSKVRWRYQSPERGVKFIREDLLETSCTVSKPVFTGPILVKVFANNHSKICDWCSTSVIVDPESTAGKDLGPWIGPESVGFKFFAVGIQMRSHGQNGKNLIVWERYIDNNQQYYLYEETEPAAFETFGFSPHEASGYAGHVWETEHGPPVKNNGPRPPSKKFSWTTIAGGPDLSTNLDNIPGGIRITEGFLSVSNAGAAAGSFYIEADDEDSMEFTAPLQIGAISDTVKYFVVAGLTSGIAVPVAAGAASPPGWVALGVGAAAAATAGALGALFNETVDNSRIGFAYASAVEISGIKPAATKYARNTGSALLVTGSVSNIDSKSNFSSPEGGYEPNRQIDGEAGASLTFEYYVEDDLFYTTFVRGQAKLDKMKISQFVDAPIFKEKRQ